MEFIIKTCLVFPNFLLIFLQTTLQVDLVSHNTYQYSVHLHAYTSPHKYHNKDNNNLPSDDVHITKNNNRRKPGSFVKQLFFFQVVKAYGWDNSSDTRNVIEYPRLAFELYAKGALAGPTDLLRETYTRLYMNESLESLHSKEYTKYHLLLSIIYQTQDMGV